MCVFALQKKKQEDQKPLEEKIKVLKKRNAELATIARRLEEKAKALQQENARNKAVSGLHPLNGSQCGAKESIVHSLTGSYCGAK